MTEIFAALGPYWAFAFTYHYEHNQCNQCLSPLTALAETIFREAQTQFHMLFSRTPVFKADALHFVVPSVCLSEWRRQSGLNSASLYVTIWSAAHTGLDTKTARFLRMRLAARHDGNG